MKLPIASLLTVALAAGFSTVSFAQDTAAPKGPPVTMGDQGKLPASETMRNAVPDMTGPATDSGATGESAGTGGSAATRPGKRMGDEPGKLPATGTMSGAVPDMRGPAPAEK